MAQIFKYQNGGNAPKKYGVFTIDGNQYDVNDEFLNQLTNYGKSLDEKTAYQFSKITDALRSGANLSYDSNANRLDGDVSFDVTDAQNNRLGKRRSGFGRFLGNSWNGKENATRLAINALKDFSYVKPSPAGTRYDWSRRINAEYEKDENGAHKLVDGKRVFIQGANNLQIRRRLEALRNIANYTDADEFIGYGQLDKQAYIDLYNKLGDEGITALIDRVENGDWTDADKMALDDIGIFLGGENESNTQKSEEELKEDKLKGQLAEKGITSPYGSQFTTIDDAGNLVVTDQFNQVFGNKNAIYNDWWQSYLTQNGAWNPDYSFLKGYTRVGNRLYKTSDLGVEGSELYNFARQQGGFYDLNAADKYGDANNILEYLWGREENSSKYDPNTLYSSFFAKNPNLRYRPLTGAYALPVDQQLIEYWDDVRDEFGRPAEYKYAILNKDGDLLQDNVNKSKYNKLGDEKQLPLEALKLINNPESPYHGRYKKEFKDDSGNIGDYTLYIDPNNPDDIILKSDGLNNWNATKGKAIRIPKELSKVINSNPEFWNRLLSDKTLQDRFIRTLAEGVRTQIGDALTTINPFSTSTLEKSDLEKLGFSSEVAEAIYKYLEDDYGDRNGESLWKRRNKYLVPLYQESTQAEEIPSHQKGGAINTTKEAVGKSASQKIDDYKDTKKVAGAQDDWNLSHADKLELASIATDIAALVAAIPTGGNPVAGALGYGSSLTQFGADVSRDGFQWGDLGSLAMNLGLDTVALLPGIGITGKLGKTAKAVSKSSRIIKRALLASGVVGAVSAVDNIASGKGTLNDWKAVFMGLTAVKGIHREVANIRSTKYKGKAPKIEGKTKEALKNEYVDKIVSNKNLGFVNGQPARWANTDGTVKNYSQAIEDLTNAGHLNISKAQEAEWAAKALASKTSAKTSNLFSGSYNPFSKNYKFDMANRQLPDNFDINQLTGKTYKLRNLGRVVRNNPEIASQLSEQGIYLPGTFNYRSPYGGNWFYRSPVFVTPTGNGRYISIEKKGGKILKAQDGTYFGGKGEGIKDFIKNLNPDMFLGLADYITSAATINKTSKKMKDAIRKGMIGSQQQTPTEFYPIFTDNGISRMYDDRIDDIRQTKTVTSDPRVLMTENLMRDVQADQLKGERDVKLSQTIDQYNNNLLAAKQQYANMRTQIANENKSRWQQGLAQLDMEDANAAMQKAQNQKQLIYQFRQDLAKDMLERDKALEASRKLQADNNFARDLMSKYGSAYNSLSKEDKEKYSSLEDYAYQTDSKGFTSLKNQHYANFFIDQYNKSRAHSWFGRSKLEPYQSPYQYVSPILEMRSEYFKKGGTVRRFRDVGEQAYLDQQKAINKAVNDLNNNIIKLFIKMMS